MLLLLIYIVIALGFSFICSIAEAVILSISSAYISVLENKGHPSGSLLKSQVNDINRPLAAILSLNTIAHTMGAAGAGAQAAVVFGDAYLGVASAVLTLLILVFSEIIPKTLGATYWRQLAPVTAYFLKYLMIVLWPLVQMAQKMTSRMHDESPLVGLNRDELSAMTALSLEEGQIAAREATVMQNLLNLKQLKVRQAMTHRTVVFSLPDTLTVAEFLKEHGEVSFSRIPIYEDNEPEKITGYVLKSDLLLAFARDNGDMPLKRFQKDMVTILSSMSLAKAFTPLHSQRGNMLLIVDEYGGLEGVLTVEDLVESLFGIDIIDESDQVVSMRKLARILAKKREKKRLARVQKSKATKID
ncbi:CNNM domain-containing protein [uncultured Paraglaciecola sp.]|uniref:CNNM domain-containing protein n=1 Tax=uncultured Paraglaciecola sp. TaxID=1765024 RepID=UPI002626DAA0|nr:CNNM domain-containing protein [uncultured Paraglaciecola sp.]